MTASKHPKLSKVIPTHSYIHSRELAYLYAQLYPQLVANHPHAFDDFVAATSSTSNLAISNPSPRAHDLAKEGDFLLRQFLWFIRPAPDFVAYPEFFSCWQTLFARRHILGVGHLLPWDALNRMAGQIDVHIAHYMANSMASCAQHNSAPALFPKYAAKQNAKGKRLVNPMKGHSSADFPLYTLLLEHPEKTLSIKLLNQAFDDLIAFALVHEAHQQQVSSIAGHSSFCGPYDFLRQTHHHGPGHALLSNVARAIRKWSDKLRYTSFEQHIAPGLAALNYTSFRQHCATLADTLKPLPLDNDYIAYFLHYFASERQSRAANGVGGGRNLRGKDAGSGGHYWSSFANAPVTEEASGHPVQVVRAQLPVTSEHLADAQDAGEDPFEDAPETPQAELVFLEDAPNSRLILNQHTSHTQQLMATLNQRIWWAQSEFTLEDMEYFMRFLEAHSTVQTVQAVQTSAADALKIMLLLGVDLEKALGALLIPNVENPGWIKGKTKPAFGLAENPHSQSLLLTSAHIDPKHASNSPHVYMDVWSYPIRTLAYLEHANLAGSLSFEPHTNRIAFRDESGLITSLKNRLGNPSVITALFATGDHNALREACTQLLSQFNRQVNIHATRTLDKRTLTLQKIQSFYRAQLQRAKLSHTLIDTLNWNTPHSQVPSLHYYTHHLHRPIKEEYQAHGQQLTGLQYALSAQTGLFNQQQLPYLPPTKNISIGATQLVKTKNIQAGVSKLITKVQRKLANPGTSNYFEFIQAINDYSLYVMLWFCMETSCRPHHIPYLNVDEIDPLHGIIKLKDKSQIGGEKYRLSYVSPELRAQMRYYAQMLEHLERYLKKFGIDFKSEANLCIFLEPAKAPSKNSARLSLRHGLSIQLLDAKQFRKLIKASLGEIAPNFYRKLMTHLFLEAKGALPISLEYIRHWLGHWTHGTAPTNEFKTTDHLAYIDAINKPLRNIIANLGFMPIELKLPRLPSQSELINIKKRMKVTTKAAKTR